MDTLTSIIERLKRHPAIAAVVVTAALLTALAVLFRPRAPLSLTRTAWVTIQQAKSNHSAASRHLIGAARERYDRAWRLIDIQLDKPLPLRTYREAEILLLQAMAIAQEAENVSSMAEREHRRQLENRISELRQLLHHHNEETRYTLHSVALRQLMTVAELKLTVAEKQLTTIDDAEPAVMEAEDALFELRSALDASYNSDGETLQMSNHWFVETLDWTAASDSAALVVVKTRHCAYLMKKGKVVTSFPVELGYRSGRQKLYSGDGATPEGIYRIVAKRDTGAAYYRALDLDYPNAYDWNRFEHARQSGLLSPHALIGGNIQVHGEGGRGSDWTEGCVAVTNSQMDLLMEQLNVGDRVTIVRRLDGWPR